MPDPMLRHAENERHVVCPACGNPEASEYDITYGATQEERERGGVVAVVISCGACGKDTERPAGADDGR